MLSYKEYKLLNESLYGALNLGLKSHGTVGGIVSDSQVNGTEAAIEAESEEAIEEAKKTKKKMDSDSDSSDDDEDKKAVDAEDHDDSEDHDEDSEDEDDEDEDDEDHDEDSEDEDEEEAKDDKPMFMKKKSKKEWSEVISDLETILEDITDDSALAEIKKGLDTIKEGMKKGHMKNHKKGCDCKLCKNNKDEGEEEGDDEGLTDAQKKLPESLKKAILAKKGKKKDDDKKCGKMMDKKCGKYMNEDEQAWWDSVNGMLGSDPNQKNWDGGWKEVGEVEQAVRE